jgi:prepilin-type N-terminal cleavage/methylation domain-containing protein
MIKKQAPLSRSESESGFTLIEILFAMGILASISVFAIQMISNQMEIRNDISILGDTQHGVHAAMSHLFDDIRHAYIIPKNLAGDANAGGRSYTPFFTRKVLGSENFLAFTTQNYRSFVRDSHQSNIAVVRYFIRKDPKDPTKDQLVRRVDTDMAERIDLDGVGIDSVLLKELKEFKVHLWDGEGFQREDWDSTTGTERGTLPKMAKLFISVYLPLSEAAAQKQALEPGRDRERKSISLESIVYLRYTLDQKDPKTPVKDYSWK